MAGFEDIGAALVGNEGGNALQYAKGLQYGAATQNALAQARERVAKNLARENLDKSLTALVPDANQRRGYVALIQSDVDPGQLANAQLRQNELTTRQGILNPEMTDDQRQLSLLSLASGPVKPFEAAGEGLVQNILHPSQGTKVTSLGDALIDQRTQSARLDEEKRLHPERFQTANPFVVTPGGVFTKTPPATPGAAPSLSKTVGPDGKPIDYAKGVGEVAGARAGAAKEAALRAASRVALPGRINDLAQFNTNLDNFLKAPGFNSIYGNLAGTELGQTATSLISQDAANAMAARDTLKSQGFTVAIQKMRGLGQLSNAEGLKVEAAMSRLFNPKISPEDAQLAAAELKAALANLENTARTEAGDAAVDAITNQAQSFASEAEAEAAGLQSGTKVVINGVAGTWQ